MDIRPEPYKLYAQENNQISFLLMVKIYIIFYAKRKILAKCYGSNAALWQKEKSWLGSRCPDSHMNYAAILSYIIDADSASA